ncbi:centrosomal protein of 41 kDa [Lepeophtheirus salmonis]|uniref:centrosomal protein of 41 kDa n=1 Tax=Lepeophtheirus salmonis TaxID=72036 RepID=UPI001AE51CE3|nr:centrosomal protein of 41 kDa-like [Lepeophtheirus salmonis]
MSYRRHTPKKISPMDKKVKPNPRYAGVESIVNSGNNIRKEIERMEEIRTFYRFRSDEIFRRIKIMALVRLMVEVAKLEIQERELNGSNRERRNEVESSLANDMDVISNPYNNNGELIQSVVDHRKQITTRSRSDLLSSVGDLMSEANFEGQLSSSICQEDEKFERPFLILDVRPENDFNENGSIIHAENYPMSRLTRSVNFESQSMLRFKIPGKRKIIVVIDEDESLSSKLATTLVERGYTNIFMLSGGLKVARILFPEKLIGHFNEKNNCLSSQDEGDVMYLESLCDEASSRGRSSRLSSYAPSRASVSLTRSHRTIDRFSGLY